MIRPMMMLALVLALPMAAVAGPSVPKKDLELLPVEAAQQWAEQRSAIAALEAEIKAAEAEVTLKKAAVDAQKAAVVDEKSSIGDAKDIVGQAKAALG